MAGHPVYKDEFLNELGWLTFAYGRLEVLLARVISSFKNPDDPMAEFNAAFRMGACRKRQELRKVFAVRCDQSRIDQKPELEKALTLLKSATEARNDIVHGVVSEEADELFFVRHDDIRPGTVDEVRAVIRGLVFAQIEILKPVHVIWAATLGRFTQKVVGE